jgi:putative spermidine/putrescine transport system ATP-binding protein
VESHLSLRGLSKRFGSTTAVEDVSLEVGQGEFVSLLGPSGCGKTTTLRMVAGFLEPSEGEILVDGKDVTALPPYRRRMGMVFQNYALFPHMNAAKNVAFGLEMRRLPKAEIAEKVKKALERVHLGAYADRRIKELSGGQQQRVALARALVIEPSVLLLDEPLSNLDKNLRDALRKEIREIQQDLGITALFVTHDQGEALTMSDRIVVLKDGRVEQVGTPEDVYERPANPFVAAFIGRANFAGARITDARHSRRRARLDSGAEVALPDAPRSGANPLPPEGVRVTLMVRPHRMRLLPPGGGGQGSLRGTVRATTYLGDLVQYEVAVGPDTFVVERAGDGLRSTGFSPKAGDEAVLEWDAEAALVFEEDPKEARLRGSTARDIEEESA